MAKLEYYQCLEAEIVSFKAAFSALLDEKDNEHFLEFIEAGEYGLALEEITGRLIQRNISVPEALYKRIESVAVQL